MEVSTEILTYNAQQEDGLNEICDSLCKYIQTNIPAAENKIWHAHPVWFLNGNPIVGYSVLKGSVVRLLFWSGQSFDEPMLTNEGKFKAAEYRFSHVNEIQEVALKRWLNKAIVVQWDYKNLVKRKGQLDRLC